MTLIRSDIDGIFNITRAIGPVSIATSTDTLSAAIDLTNFPGWKVLLVAATGTYTDGSYTVTLQQSDTSGGSYADITPFSGSTAAISAANTLKTSAYQPTKLFLKVNVHSTGVTSGALVSASVILVPPTA